MPLTSGTDSKESLFPTPVPAVCLNVRTPDGENPFPAVLEVRGLKIAGALGSGIQLPAGWKRVPPEEVEAARADVLLFRGSELEAIRYARKTGARIVLIPAPFARSKAFPAGALAFVYVPSGGESAARLSLSGNKDTPVRKLRAVLPTEIPEDLKALLPRVSAAKVSPPESPPGEALRAGVSLFPHAAAQHKGVRVEVKEVHLLRAFGAGVLSRGVYIVCRVGWVNRIPFKLIKKELRPVAYKVENLFDNVFLYADGRFVLPLSIEENSELGETPHILLKTRGDKAERRLVFKAPAVPSESLDLIFLDSVRGHFLIPLWGRRPAPPSFTSGPAQNDFLSFGVISKKEVRRLGELEAGPERFLLVVELAGKSVLKGEFEGRECGFVVNFSPRGFIQLVEDDLFPYDPVPGGGPYSFSGRQKFIPQLYHSGRLVFRIPQDHGALRLWIFMPAERKVESGKVSEKKPRPISLLLGGSPRESSEPPAEALRTIRDGDILQIVIYKPSNENGLHVCSFEITNIGKQPEIFRPYEQILAWTAEGRKPIEKKSVSRLLRGAPKYVRLPPGGKRRIGLVFPPKSLGVVYRGFTRADVTPFPGTPKPEPGSLDLSAVPEKKTRPGEPPVERRELPPPKPVKVPQRKPAGLKAVGLSADAVNAAIEKAADYLAAFLLRGGWGDPDYDYLIAYAVLHSERFRKDPELASWILDYFRNTPAEGTYSVGLRLMGLRALDPARHRKLIAQCASYLIACQDRQGLWSYGPPQVESEEEESEKDRGEIYVLGGRPIRGYGTGLAPVTQELPAVYDRQWRYAGGGDFSCTQYAALGLKAAEESGLLVPKEVWLRLAKICAEGQADDGGWSYGPGAGTGYGSMTAAGFATYLIACHYAGIKPDPKVVKRGYEWLSRYFTVKENPGAAGWYYYYLYGLERAGVIAAVEFFGENEWYPLLAKQLLDTQRPDGSWPSEGAVSDARMNTAFAILCLRRATVPLGAKPLEPQGGKGTLVTGVKGTGTVTYIILDASRSMLAPFDGRTRFEWACNTVKAIVERLPPKAPIALRVYGARTRPNHPAADRDTVLVVPPVRGSREVIPDVLKLLSPKGRTPLALSLQQTSKDLQEAAAEKPAVLVLIADGEESDPNADPFAAARNIGSRRETRFWVIGIATDKKAKAFLKRLAAEGKGRYFHASAAEDLRKAVKEELFESYPFVVRDQFGKEVARGEIGEKLALPEGRYEIEVKAGKKTYVRPFWINTGKKTLVLFQEPR